MNIPCGTIVVFTDNESHCQFTPVGTSQAKKSFDIDDTWTRFVASAEPDNQTPTEFADYLVDLGLLEYLVSCGVSVVRHPRMVAEYL